MTNLIRATRRGMDRRGFLRAGAAFGAITAMPRGAHAQAAGEITLWTPGGSPLFCQIHTGLLDEFAASGGVDSVAIQCGTGGGDDYAQTLLGGIASGNPPDISMLWDSPVVMGSQGAFVALDDYMAGSQRIRAEDWPPGLLRTTQWQGKTYGLPVTAGVYGMWYNEEMFEAKGIPTDRESFPKTWDELRRLSKEFTVWDGDRLEVAGFTPLREASTLPVWSALNGSQIFDEPNARYTIDSPENIEMMDYHMAWLDEEYRGDINLIDRSGNFRQAYPDDNTGLNPAFREGRQAGLEMGSWLMGDFYTDPEPTFERWNIARHPVGPSGGASVSGTWPNWFVIPVGSRNVEAAVAYLEFLSVEGAAQWYRQIPDIPTNRNAPDVLPQVVVDRRGEAFATDVAAFLREQQEIVTPMWNSPVEAFGQDQLSRALERIYTKAATPAEALAEAQAASQAELERALAG